MKGSNVLTKTVAAALLTCALLLGAAACSASDVKASKFESELKSTTELTDAQAKCVTDKSYSEFDQEQINDIYTSAGVDNLGAGLDEMFTSILSECVVKK